MSISRLYRQRLIPAEHILLKDDLIVAQDARTVFTKWNTLNPKTEFSHGSSCYFLQEGIKVSKFYRRDNSLLYWYIDIGEYSFDETAESMTFTDLLADVVVFPDGRIKVIDLDELAEALERGLITKEQMITCLRSLNRLLTMLYRDKFDRLQAPLNSLGL